MVRDLPEDMVGILVPKGSDRRLSTEKATGEKWYWRREREGWPNWEKVESEGEKMVAERN